MNNLMYAGWARLKKEKIFWCLMLLMIVSALLMCMSCYQSVKQIQQWQQESEASAAEGEADRQDIELYGASPFDGVFFQWAAVTGQVVAVFAGFFIGTDYSDGTLRNKILAGHGRSAIYLSGFWFCTIAGVLINLAYMGVVMLVGIPLFGGSRMAWDRVALLLFDGLIMTAAFGAISNLISMLISSRTYGLMANIAVTCLMMMIVVLVWNALHAPEFIQMVEMHINGESVPSWVPNPRYLTGALREAYQFVEDMLPSGQGAQMASLEMIHADQWWLYSGIITIAVNAAGCLAFRKKNLN